MRTGTQSREEGGRRPETRRPRDGGGGRAASIACAGGSPEAARGLGAAAGAGIARGRVGKRPRGSRGQDA